MIPGWGVRPGRNHRASKTVDKQSMESSFDMLKKMIRDMDLAHKKLGVELAYLNVPYFRQLQETFPKPNLWIYRPCLYWPEAWKAEDEIQMFRTLCRIADEGFTR